MFQSRADGPAEGGDSHSLPLGTSWGQAQGCCLVGVEPARPAHLSSRGRRLWGDPDKDPVTDCVLKPSVRCPKGTGRAKRRCPQSLAGAPAMAVSAPLPPGAPGWGQSYGTRTQTCYPSLRVLWNPTRILRGEGLRLGVWGPGNDHVGHCPPSGSVLTADPSPRRPEGQCMLPDRSLQSNAWVFRDRTASLGSPPSSRLGFSTGLISVLGCFSQGPNKQVGSGKSGPTRDGPLGGGASHVRGTG